MRRLSRCFLAACSLLVSIPCSAQSIRNGGFEEGPEMGVPVGWTVGGAGTKVELVTVGVRDGAYAVRLSRTGAAAPGQFGTLVQSVDAAPYRGNRVRLRGWVKTDPAAPGAVVGLWLRADRADRQRGFFDNMQDRPIRGANWQRYEIVGDVAEDATHLVFGLLLQGNGSAWLDAMSLEVVGPASPPVREAARPLTPRAIQNLVALGRLLGYVRYFHPSDEAVAADWNAIAVEGVRAVESAPDPAALADVLNRHFQPVAAGVIVSTGRGARYGTELPRGREVVAWRHLGVGLGTASSLYRSTRLRAAVTDGVLPDSFPHPDEPMVVDLGGGVSATVPLALYADSTGTLPPGTPATVPPVPQPTQGAFSGDDRATRLAGVLLAWNVFQHFYPYFDAVEVDWSAELQRALSAAAIDVDATAFLETLQLMIAALQDGHGSVTYAADGALRVPAVLWDWIEEQLVITVAAPGITAVRPGDVVLRIDGRPAAEALADVEVRTSSATPQWRRYRALRTLLVGPEGSEISLAVRSPDGSTRSVTLPRSEMPGTAPVEARPEPLAEVRPGIFYLDLDRITDEAFTAALPQLASAQGLIFDLRGYPRQVNAAMVLAHLLSERGTSAQWHVPVTMLPDRADMRFQRGGEWDLRPLQPHLPAPRVFITDGRAVSYAESVMGIVENYRLAEIVGQTTAGTNGNVNPFILPGGYRVSWTGMKVLKHDGSRHHGVGIRPTIPMVRTIAGVAAGRDELLERAIEVLERPSSR
ncbi:MAG TPA: S41 family peptidase [Longimicrobiales bacterium]|nr:S41 family peptidase [Longimicrobiales bacterium]